MRLNAGSLYVMRFPTKIFNMLFKGYLFSIVIPSSKTSSLASTLIEFIFNICIFQGWLSMNLV